MSNRKLPEAVLAQVIFSVSPGPTGLRNFTELTWQTGLEVSLLPDGARRNVCIAA